MSFLSGEGWRARGDDLRRFGGVGASGRGFDRLFEPLCGVVGGGMESSSEALFRLGGVLAGSRTSSAASARRDKLLEP